MLLSLVGPEETPRGLRNLNDNAVPQHSSNNIFQKSAQPKSKVLRTQRDHDRCVVVTMSVVSPKQHVLAVRNLTGRPTRRTLAGNRFL